MNGLNEKLNKNGFILVKNFIDFDRAKNLYEELCKSEDAKIYDSGDSRITYNTQNNVYNFREFLELLCEKTPTVSNLIGEFVLPTYTFGRIYKKDSILTKHTDRPSCEISLTVHLWGDKEWPFCVKNFEEKDVEIVLAPGDAILYLGCEIEHWRTSYSGDKYGQVFLHYVRSNGPNWNHYFDRLHFANSIKEEVEKKVSNAKTNKLWVNV